MDWSIIRSLVVCLDRPSFQAGIFITQWPYVRQLRPWKVPTSFNIKNPRRWLSMHRTTAARWRRVRERNGTGWLGSLVDAHGKFTILRLYHDLRRKDDEEGRRGRTTRRKHCHRNDVDHDRTHTCPAWRFLSRRLCTQSHEQKIIFEHISS
jgi:hypothetical protein